MIEINRFGIIFDTEIVGKMVHCVGQRTMNRIVKIGFMPINDNYGMLTAVLDNGKVEFVDNIDAVEGDQCVVKRALKTSN